jgi:7,8-dihydro-6-hydroxymethylpterin-pyrophosphokinase
VATPSGATPAAALVAIGSNIDPWDNVPRAVELLSRAETVTGVSRFYRTASLCERGVPA